MEVGAGLKVKMIMYKEVCDLLVSALRNLQSRENSTFLGYDRQMRSELDHKRMQDLDLQQARLVKNPPAM